MQEQRRYRTKIMLSEIIKSASVQRSTLSPGAALDQASQVKPFMKVTDPKDKLKEQKETDEDIIAEEKEVDAEKDEKAFITGLEPQVDDQNEIGDSHSHNHDDTHDHDETHEHDEEH